MTSPKINPLTRSISTNQRSLCYSNGCLPVRGRVLKQQENLHTFKSPLPPIAFLLVPHTDVNILL